MRQVVPFAAKKESVSPTIKMAAQDADVKVASEDQLAVSVELSYAWFDLDNLGIQTAKDDCGIFLSVAQEYSEKSPKWLRQMLNRWPPD